MSIVKTVPSQEKNQTCFPAFFQGPSRNFRIVIDCTDIEVAIPSPVDLQKQTYYVYRSMYYFKLLQGVVPNAVITYCSDLYPGSVSDKAIVQKSGFLEDLHVWRHDFDRQRLDRGFLIQSLMPAGVTEHSSIPEPRKIHRY